tara:strand:+ start:135 stop:332 length:198 start_codon:yes stop_codon:yes gene_type:complete
MSRNEMSDSDFVSFQDKFYDLLQNFGVSEIDCEHKRWDDICEIRNKVVEFIEEQNYLQIHELPED